MAPYPNYNINRIYSINSNLNYNNLFSQYMTYVGSFANPTNEVIINALPETQIGDISKLDEDKKNCIICLEDFKTGDKALILPCIHLFHTECIKKWLESQNSCPICKFELTADNPEVDENLKNNGNNEKNAA